ncbi:hypothetical protein GCM10010344_70250 [Streptomyces bluensis]|nr:hypothetical protein GCM10010344_70250 [Streptomyces bluensis]
MAAGSLWLVAQFPAPLTGGVPIPQPTTDGNPADETDRPHSGGKRQTGPPVAQQRHRQPCPVGALRAHAVSEVTLTGSVSGALWRSAQFSRAVRQAWSR